MAALPATTDASRESSAAIGSADLPSELHLLFVAPEEPSWTLLTLQLDRHGCSQPRFHWCSDLASAARIVHQERFDCIVIDDASPRSGGAATGDNELLPQVSALRTAGCLDPLLVISDRVDDDWLEQMANADCELLVTRDGWRSRAVVPWIRCAMERHTVAREHQEIGERGRQSTERESNESRMQLDERMATARRLVERTGHASAAAPTGEALSTAYGDLLRSSVLATSEQVQDHIARVAYELVRGDCTASEVLALHVDAVEQLLKGLGGRSVRHVLQRTDLFALEMLVHVADCAARPTFATNVSDRGVDLETLGE